ncbi:hypothetical protein [Halarchaeum nitratireducens]|uniref:Transcription factor zinc-finger domain-containing protein n=1 Tax=Halarchaeum nitratireducens TaxID=489913 RepID=A0A830G9U0_9EURY|nr:MULTISPECIES: hypothetical protein [Halarchaeum]MBP2249985.1 hypothetical protein [Halarchaeum solikamskense]GGN09292.1 hypothetical protein GCM10009021_05990 [Halarchaeum nitratireducens]
MRATTVECPRCEAAHEFFLQDEERHLRQCPDCDGWFVFAEAESGLKRTALDDPAACPVAGCEERVDADDLPAHVVDTHDGSLD